MVITTKPKVVSLFSGAGGLDLGFKNAGFDIVFATDIWDLACETLKANSSARDIFCGDVREIDFKKIKNKVGQVDCIIGGPPCPPYSQTRHYLTHMSSGFGDRKAGFAVPEYFRAVEEMNPKIFFFENVDGFAFKTHLTEFEYLLKIADSLGYTLSYRVVNCADYGVPQTRKRFICIGTIKELSKFVFPECTHSKDGKDGKKNWVTCGEVLAEFDNITESEKHQCPGAKDYELLCEIPAGGNYLYFTDKRGYPNPKFKWKSRYWTFLLKLTPNRPSWTIQASFSTNQGPFHWRNRFLRIEELKRLQTFPDDYRLMGDTKEQWRQIGNAVPVKVAEIIARRIKEVYFNAE